MTRSTILVVSVFVMTVIADLVAPGQVVLSSPSVTPAQHMRPLCNLNACDKAKCICRDELRAILPMLYNQTTQTAWCNELAYCPFDSQTCKWHCTGSIINIELPNQPNDQQTRRPLCPGNTCHPETCICLDEIKQIVAGGNSKHIGHLFPGEPNECMTHNPPDCDAVAPPSDNFVVLANQTQQNISAAEHTARKTALFASDIAICSECWCDQRCDTSRSHFRPGFVKTAQKFLSNLVQRPDSAGPLKADSATGNDIVVDKLNVVPGVSEKQEL